jgi:hypothetical protein
VLRAAASIVAALAAVLALSGCGADRGTPNGGSGSAAPAGSAAALLARPGPDLVLTAGTSDYAPGRLRFTFLVIDSHGRSIERPTARVWVARTLESKPFAQTVARLESVGVPGVSEAAAGDVTHLYVTHFRANAPGRYYVVAEPVGGRRVQGVADLVVTRHSTAPAVGAKAFPSRTPTMASTGGDVKALTTRKPPDVALLRYSVADSLAARVPFVLTFATPAFCESRTCGPVVDVVDHVRKRIGSGRVRFIHVEIYENNQPPETNRWVKQWKLPSEPWIFLVGRDGRIKGRFEGSASAAELEAAVRRQLLR